MVPDRCLYLIGLTILGVLCAIVVTLALINMVKGLIEARTLKARIKQWEPHERAVQDALTNWTQPLVPGATKNETSNDQKMTTISPSENKAWDFLRGDDTDSGEEDKKWNRR
jgi:hypothetical protein